MISHKQIVDHLIVNSGTKNQKDLVDQVSVILGLGETSVYNKLNDRSKFSLTEIMEVFAKFNISLDQIMYNNAKHNAFTPFFADGLKYKPRNYGDYIDNIMLYYSKIKQLKDVKGYFLANEVPLFHFLSFPYLMYLKLYIWNKTNWQIEGISNNFDYNQFANDFNLKKSISLLKELYFSFPDIEVWNPNMLDNTISQFEYLIDIGIINSPDDIFNIKKEFKNLVDYLEELTLIGYKPLNSKQESKECNVYVTDLNIGSEVILVRSENLDLLFQQIDVPNYMRTTDPRMIDNQFRFFENIRKISTHITMTGEKERFKFFKKLRERINAIS